VNTIHIISIVLLLTLSGCSSRQAANASCDFVHGAAENEHDRKRENNSRGRKHEADSDDAINGFFAVLLGPLNRAMSHSEKSDGCL